jgi:hypothetical protein
MNPNGSRAAATAAAGRHVRLVLIDLFKRSNLGYHKTIATRPGGPPTGGRLVIEPLANDPDDDGNALVGVKYALLIEVGLVALFLLLHWLL